MIVGNKSRRLDSGQVIECYRNLHKQGMFSLRDSNTGLVVAHGNNFVMNNVIARVSKNGRQRVIDNKRKSVHAWLFGEYRNEITIDTDNLDEIYYEPYTLDGFINRKTGEKLDFVSSVYFDDKGKCWIVER